VEINVAELAINDLVHVKDLKIENVTVLENGEAAVLGVMPPALVKEAEEAPVAEAEATAEPEVVGKGKKPEEGEAPAGEEKEKEKEKDKDKEKDKKK
jgi:hypothetical protein